MPKIATSSKDLEGPRNELLTLSMLREIFSEEEIALSTYTSPRKGKRIRLMNRYDENATAKGLYDYNGKQLVELQNKYKNVTLFTLDTKNRKAKLDLVLDTDKDVVTSKFNLANNKRLP